MEKFGKPNKDIISQTESFVKENDSLIALNTTFSDFYRLQPKRAGCKICESPFSPDRHLDLRAIRYFLCSTCGHLTGEFEDTNAFCDFVYSKHGAEYAAVYNLDTLRQFNTRTEKIFRPKAEFLLKGLAEQREEPTGLKYADLGTGAGCFVHALQQLGIRDVAGYDVEGSQIALARQILGVDSIKSHAIEETLDIIKSLDCDVVSLIGVLEHVQYPHEVLTEISRNERIRYLFLSVPLFSPAVLFQIPFPRVFERHLSGGHTHLFTESSLYYLCARYHLTKVSEWWFGLDMSDLYRSILVSLDKANQPDIVMKTWCDWFAPAIDAMQLALDTNKLSSEVHVLLKVRHEPDSRAMN